MKKIKKRTYWPTSTSPLLYCLPVARTDIDCLVRGYHHQLHTFTLEKCLFGFLWQALRVRVFGWEIFEQTYFALFLCQRTCVAPIKLDISTKLTGCVPTNPNVFANINTMTETFPSPDLHIVYLPLLEGPSNKGPAHLQCQNSHCHISFIKRITTTLMKTITSWVDCS